MAPSAPEELKTLTTCWYPCELGKRTPFFPTAHRLSVPVPHGLALTSPWGTLVVHGQTLIVADHTVLLALLQLADRPVFDGVVWRRHYEGSVYELAVSLGYSRPCGPIYTTMRASLDALATTVFEVRTARFRLIAPLIELRWEHDPDPAGRLQVTIHASLVQELRVGRVELIQLPLWRELSSLGKLLYGFLSAQAGDRFYAIALSKLRTALNADPLPVGYGGWRMNNFKREVTRQLEILRTARVVEAVRWRTGAAGCVLSVWLPGQQTLALPAPPGAAPRPTETTPQAPPMDRPFTRKSQTSQ